MLLVVAVAGDTAAAEEYLVVVDVVVELFAGNKQSMPFLIGR
jgi:hypothetical protein